MLKVNTIQTNFTSGELSPWLLGRSDIERYQNGAETIENMLVRHQGGVVRRLGTKNVSRAAEQDIDAVVRVQEFAFSRDDAVLVEISLGRFRFSRRRQRHRLRRHVLCERHGSGGGPELRDRITRRRELHDRWGGK